METETKYNAQPTAPLTAQADAELWRYVESQILELLAAREIRSPYRALMLSINRGPAMKLDSVTVTLVRKQEGFLQQNMENCNNSGVCEGGCNFHEGELNTVRVIDPSGSGHDWGYYRYCEKAVVADKERGFNVFFEGDELFKANAQGQP